jgi:hypothetical protein
VPEKIIPQLKDISPTNFPHLEKINTAEELYVMHQTWPEKSYDLKFKNE